MAIFLSGHCLCVVGLVLSLAAATPAGAGEADVLDATAEQGAGDGVCFRVTVRHADGGWDHYADRWEILAPDGEEVARRVLLHPHVEEQPFTRSLCGVSLPEGVGTVRVRAHDSIHGYGGREIEITVPR